MNRRTLFKGAAALGLLAGLPAPVLRLAESAVRWRSIKVARWRFTEMVRYHDFSVVGTFDAFHGAGKFIVGQQPIVDVMLDTHSYIQFAVSDLERVSLPESVLRQRFSDAAQQLADQIGVPCPITWEACRSESFAGVIRTADAIAYVEDAEQEALNGAG